MHRRIPLDFEASVTTASGSELEVRIVEASQGGLLLQSAHSLRENGPLEFHYHDGEVQKDILLTIDPLHERTEDEQYFVGCKVIDANQEHLNAYTAMLKRNRFAKYRVARA